MVFKALVSVEPITAWYAGHYNHLVSSGSSELSAASGYKSKSGRDAGRLLKPTASSWSEEQHLHLFLHVFERLCAVRPVFPGEDTVETQKV